MSESPTGRVTRHHLAPEEAAALAWMLEITAEQRRTTGDLDSAAALEGGAVSLRIAGAHAGEYQVGICDVAIGDLTSIAWEVLDRNAQDPNTVIALAEPEWSRIGADLVTRDDTGGAFTTFLMECPLPEDLPAYGAGLVSRLRTLADLDVAVQP